MFDHILRHAEFDVQKLGIGYPSFIFGILMAQNSSILSRTDSFSGPPSAQSSYFYFCQRMPKGDIVGVSKLSQSTSKIKCMLRVQLALVPQMLSQEMIEQTV